MWMDAALLRALRISMGSVSIPEMQAIWYGHGARGSLQAAASLFTFNGAGVASAGLGSGVVEALCGAIGKLDLTLQYKKPNKLYGSRRYG
jgi:hypothetical protein